jgi:hypothetical protein
VGSAGEKANLSTVLTIWNTCRDWKAVVQQLGFAFVMVVMFFVPTKLHKISPYFVVVLLVKFLQYKTKINEAVAVPES